MNPLTSSYTPGLLLAPGCIQACEGGRGGLSQILVKIPWILADPCPHSMKVAKKCKDCNRSKAVMLFIKITKEIFYSQRKTQGKCGVIFTMVN